MLGGIRLFPHHGACTRVGHACDEWALPASASRPIGIVLVGCGAAGRGVYEAVRRYSQAFDLQSVVVREAERCVGIQHLTTDPAVALDANVNVVIISSRCAETVSASSVAASDALYLNHLLRRTQNAARIPIVYWRSITLP
jgi:hypothetical protein